MEAALALIGEDLKNVELQFKKDLQSDVPLIRKVGEYVLASGGKRIRPALLLLSASLCGYNGDRSVPLASVIEFIHTATLLHDDVVDNANLRRGIASANTLWGNEASVLVGDFLFSKSFSLMVADGDLRVLKLLSGATTIIAEGEVLQHRQHYGDGALGEELLTAEHRHQEADAITEIGDQRPPACVGQVCLQHGLREQRETHR